MSEDLAARSLVNQLKAFIPDKALMPAILEAIAEPDGDETVT